MSAPTRRYRWLIAAIGLLVVVACTPLAIPAWHNWRIDRDLAQAIAETDRLDPGWRLEELQVRSESIPDDENAAVQIRRISRLLGDKSYSPEFRDVAPLLDTLMARLDWASRIEGSLDDAPDHCQLTTLQIEALQSEMKQHKEAMAEARKLRHYSKCCFEQSGFKSRNDAVSASRSPVRLLNLAFLHHCQAEADNDAHDCLRSLLKLAEFQNGEPNAGAQLAGLATVSIACQVVGRMLGQTEPRPDVLAELQRTLHETEKATSFLSMARNYRAEGWHLYQQAQHGSEQFRKFYEESLIASWKSEEQPEPPWYLRWFVRKRGLDMRDIQAKEMRLANQAIEFAKKPIDRQAAEFTDLVQMRTASHPDMRSWAMEGLAKAIFRTVVHLRATRVALAAEHYRQARDRWPKSLDALVPEYLEEVPIDLFSGKALIYRRVDQGVVVYSVGQDGVDSNGTLRPDGTTLGFTGLDIGTRLWDAEQRRQRAP